MTRSLTAIVLIGILGLVLFGLAAYTVTDKSPKIRLRLALERDFPVRVASVELARLPPLDVTTLRVVIEPKATLSTDDLGALASRAAFAVAGDGESGTGPQALEVRLSDGRSVLLDTLGMARRADLEKRLRDMEATLGTRWEKPPHLRLVPRDDGVFGVALAQRPPAPADGRAIAEEILSLDAAFAFVDIPEHPPGRSSSRIDRRR